MCKRGVPLYTEMSSFQGIGLEGFHCLQKYLTIPEVFHCRGWIPLYTDVFSFQGVEIDRFTVHPTCTLDIFNY